MNEQQKMRLVILCGALIIFCSGIGAWTWYQNEKQQELDMNSQTLQPHVQLASRRPTVEEPSAPAATPQLEKKTADAQTAAKPITPAASKQPDAKPVQPTAKPVVTAAATQPNQPSSAAVTPAAGKTAAAPVKPAVAKAEPAPARPTASKPAVAAEKPALPNGAPLKPAVATKPAAPATNDKAAQAPPPVVPTAHEVVPATTFAIASHAAHKDVGRDNPTKPLAAFLPFPRAVGHKSQSDDEVTPPPPPDTTKGDTKTDDAKSPPKGDLVPPPPPGDASNDLGIDDLPPPPDKPHTGDSLKVLGVIDDRAIVAFPQTMCSKNNWPKTITLATGQQFDSIKVVRVSPEGVTIEEDGERSLKPVPAIK